MQSAEFNIYAATLLAPAVPRDKVAIWHRPSGAPDEVPLTFGGLRHQAGRVAHWVRARGLPPGAKVLVLLPMSPAFYAAVLGIAQAGAISVFPDPGAGRSGLRAVIERCQPVAVVGAPAARWLRVVLPALRQIPHAVWLPPFEEVLPGAPSDAEVMPVGPDDPAVVVHTTGSTGTPKAVERSHGFILKVLKALGQHPSKHPDAVDLPLWPMLLFDGLCHGRTSVIPDLPGGRLAELDAGRLLAQIRRRGVSLLVGPPTALEALCGAVEASGGGWPVRHVFVGGALVLPALLRRLQALVGRGEALAVYGSTEADPVSVLSAHQLATLEPSAGVCAGAIHPDIRLRVVAPSSEILTWEACRDVPPGGVGEILVTGGHVAGVYHEDPEAFAAHKVRDPEGRIWHRMGDLGSLDARGLLWLHGRLGARVTTAEGPLDSLVVEALAQSVPGVQAAALLGRGSAAWIVVQPEPDADLHDLLHRLQQALRGLAPLRVVFHPELPRDPRHHSRIDLRALASDLPDDPPGLPPREPAPPWWRGAWAYMVERFPLHKNVVGVGLMVGTDGLATLALVQQPFTSAVWHRLAIVIVLFTLVFYHLRVFDEHKDRAVDRIAFPERVLSRGWVTLDGLRLTAWAAVLAEVGLAAWTSPVLLGWTGVLIAYTWLMLREFYVAAWLKRHMVMYGISHMAIITLMSVAVYAAVLDVLPPASVTENFDRTLGGALPSWTARLWHPGLLLFAGMNFCFVYSLEVARKIRVPEQERPQVDTYSRRLGLRGALVLVVVTQAVGLGMLGVAGPWLHVHPAVYGTGVGCLALVAVAFYRFGRHPEAEVARRLESIGALTVLLVNAVMIGTWGWMR